MNQREREAVDYLTNVAIGMAASNRTLYRSLATEINIVLAALRQQGAQQEGMVLVPVEPTLGMIQAAIASYKFPDVGYAGIYKAMIAAKP